MLEQLHSLILLDQELIQFSYFYTQEEYDEVYMMLVEYHDVLIDYILFLYKELHFPAIWYTKSYNNKRKLLELLF